MEIGLTPTRYRQAAKRNVDGAAVGCGHDVVLTFDDGPGPSTLRLLSVLQRAERTAIFFVLGCNLERHMDIALRIVRNGHPLGNHTYSHARDGMITPAELRAEIDATDALIRQVYVEAGLPPPTDIPLRLPYGCAPDDGRAALLADLNRPHVGWTLLLDDWQRPPPTVGALVAAMLGHVQYRLSRKQRVVLCLHDSSRLGEARPATVAAVEAWLTPPRMRVQSEEAPG